MQLQFNNGSEVLIFTNSKTLLIMLVLMLESYRTTCQGYFTDATRLSNIQHTHVAPNLMGGGIGIFDFNNDGFEDFYATGGVYEDKVFQNNGDGTFQEFESMELFEATRSIHTMGVITGDVNNDGFDDVFVTTERGERDILFLNRNGESFENVTQTAGIKGTNWSMGASIGDYNLDGYLDIYVIGYLKIPHVLLNDKNEIIGFAHECYRNKLYTNNGNATFTENAVALNVANEGCGLAVAFTDVNGDSQPDLYVANDFGEWTLPNTYYKNDSTSHTFLDLSKRSGLDIAVYGMGVAVGDIDNDGLFDYYITNLGKNALMQQQSNGHFKNVTDSSQVMNEFSHGRNSTSWGTEFFDYDHDGFEDLFVSNGYIGAATFLNTTTHDPNKLFKNNGDHTFSDVSTIEQVDNLSFGRGMVTFDFDNDGDLDILTSNVSPVKDDVPGLKLFKNLKGNEKNWLKVKLQGVQANPNGIGSKVICYYQNQLWVDEISGGSSHASKKSSFAHFGLSNIDKLDSMMIIWPGGKKQSFYDVTVNRFLLIRENIEQPDILGCMDPANRRFDSEATYNFGCISSYTLALSPTQNSVYSFYPNPTSSFLFVKFKNKLRLEIQLHNIHGFVILSKSLLPGDKIDVSALHPGIYYLTIEHEFYQKIWIR